MSVVLADTKNSNVSRQAAGLQLKNCLTSKDASLKEKYQRRWSNLPCFTCKIVRKRLISSLGTENISPSCAAQCLAYILAAELLLPETKYNSVGNMLVELSDIVSKPADAHRTEAALESIAYICQEIVS
jgi:importin subunit beta-1